MESPEHNGPKDKDEDEDEDKGILSQKAFEKTVTD